MYSHTGEVSRKKKLNASLRFQKRYYPHPQFLVLTIIHYRNLTNVQCHLAVVDSPSSAIFVATLRFMIRKKIN
jgi:hypothetical protein